MKSLASKVVAVGAVVVAVEVIRRVLNSSALWEEQSPHNHTPQRKHHPTLWSHQHWEEYSSVLSEAAQFIEENPDSGQAGILMAGLDTITELAASVNKMTIEYDNLGQPDAPNLRAFQQDALYQLRCFEDILRCAQQGGQACLEEMKAYYASIFAADNHAKEARLHVAEQIHEVVNPSA